MQPSTLNLALVLAVAFVLRVWGLSSGVPFAVGVDEPAIMAPVLRIMKSGSFNPHFFDYPGLAIYAHLAVASVRFMAGAMGGLWSSLAQVGPADFYMWGRAVTALVGTGTVLVIHQVGLRWGARHALLAAGLLAVMPLHVRESHYLLTDVPLTFFVALTLLLSLRAQERPSLSTFAWAGAAAGLAAGTKYNGLVALVMPLVAASAITSVPGSRLRRAIAATGASVAAFLLVAPFTVLDLPGFLEAFGHLAMHFRPRSPALEPGWLLYLKHLLQALGWPGFLLAVSGMVLVGVRAVKGPGQTRAALTLVFVLLYFWLISRSNQLFGRYALPLVPMVCLWAAIATISGVSLLRRFAIPRFARTTLIAGLTVAALLPPSITSLKFDRGLGVQTTQALAWAWIATRTFPGATVVSEARGLDLPEPRYRVEHVKDLPVREASAYLDAGVDYLIASDEVFGPAMADPATAAAYQRIFDAAADTQVFRPSADHPGPEIRILRLRR